MKTGMLAGRPRLGPIDSARMLRDLGIGCGSVLLGIAALVAGLSLLIG